MERHYFLNAIIDDGIEEVRHTYLRPDQMQKREGAIAGLEACRSLRDPALIALLQKAAAKREQAYSNRSPRYWYYRLYELQVEWVMNVLSASYYNQGLKTIITPTARGLAKAADILGVAERK